MVTYISSKTEALAAPDALWVTWQSTEDPEWLLVSIERVTKTNEDCHEQTPVADDQRMTRDGMKSRAEELAVQFGIPVYLAEE